MEGDLLTVAINLAGIPGINVPSTSENVINAGMQFLGKKKAITIWQESLELMKDW